MQPSPVNERCPFQMESWVKLCWQSLRARICKSLFSGSSRTGALCRSKMGITPSTFQTMTKPSKASVVAMATALCVYGVAASACPNVAMTLESSESHMALAPFGIRTNETWCANGYAVVCPQGMSLEKWLNVSGAQVQTTFAEYLATQNVSSAFGGVFTLDMESPVGLKNLWRYSATNQSRIAKAIRMRIEVAKRLLPNAAIGVYGIIVVECATNPVNVTCWQAQVGALQRAATVDGMLDQADALVPVWYTGAGMASADIYQRARASLACVMFLGPALLATPFLSYETFPQGTPMDPLVGRQLAQLASNGSVTSLDCPAHPHYGLTPSQPQHQPRDARQPLVQFWAGCDNSSFAIPWFSEARVVPTSCLGTKERMAM